VNLLHFIITTVIIQYFCEVIDVNCVIVLQLEQVKQWYAHYLILTSHIY